MFRYIRLGGMFQMPLIQLIQMFKINLWMWYKVLQIKHRVLQYQIRLRVPQFKTQLRVPQTKIRPKSLQVKFQLKVLQFKFQFKVLLKSVKIYPPSHHHRQLQYTSPCRYCSAHSLDNLSKLDRKET